MVQTTVTNLNIGQMTALEFCYWLQGYFELGGDTKLTEDQVKMIKQHLYYVFTPGTIATVSSSIPYHPQASQGWGGYQTQIDASITNTDKVITVTC